MEIPQCRKGFTLEDARSFIDRIMDVFRSLEDMSDLRSMYETGKQLSRAYFDCHLYRTELAQHLTNCEYPAFASKMMKKLNNMGVFKNDDIWFSSFYFYNTTWNFSDTWPDFATALASAGLPNLLNLNIGHQPYLENLSSKNVYYLIKASLSIIHNIARTPGNTHHFASESVRQALLHLVQREEEFLRCVSTLCLTHIITESETHLITDASPTGIDLPHILLGYINAARLSEKRRCHGFQVIELLYALSALSVHDTLKSSLLNLCLPVTGGGNSSDQGFSCSGLLKDLLETALSTSASPASLREAEEATKILWNLTIDPSIIIPSAQNQIRVWVSDLVTNPSASGQFTKSMLRSLESVCWKLTHNVALLDSDIPFTSAPSVFISFAPSNRIAVGRLADRLREARLPVCNTSLVAETMAASEATAVGMSMCACNASTRAHWLECIDQASVMIVCLSDSYRLSPGCRLESEYFISRGSDIHPKQVIPVIIQPKLKPTGWVTRLSTRHPIDLNGKRDIEASYETLISQLKDMLAEAKSRVEASMAALTAHRHSSVDGKRHMAIAGDTGLTAVSSTEPTVNHINGNVGTGCRTTSGMSIKRDDAPTAPTPHAFLPKGLNPSVSLSALTTSTPRPTPTNAWRHVVRPEIRNWSTSTVATWLRFRGLGHISANMAGGIDGVLLSQLAGLRLWAPEYFNQSIRSELGLGFTDSLRFLEALDELAPEEDDQKLNEDCNTGDPHPHPNTVEGGVFRH